MKRTIAFFLLASLVLNSCDKKEELNSSGQVVVTGKNKLIVSIMHHTRSLSDIHVYLKYNATEYPGNDTTVYEWHTTSDNSGIAVFDKLFEGNYFLYGEGVDQGIGLHVIGAAPAVLNSSTITNNEVYITLYVTE
ncbi:MAG: hypothetical protein ABI763_13720 [Bacteroidota bacterium]